MSETTGVQFTRFDWVQFYVTSAILFFARSTAAAVIIAMVMWLCMAAAMCLTTGWMDAYENGLKAAFMIWNMVAWLYGAPPVDIKGIFG